LRRNSNSSAATIKVNQRRVPVKVHIPSGAGPYPVIVISHGAGGNWDTHYAQAQHLASHGYAVFCVEHVGSNTERLKSGFRLMENLNRMTRDSNEVLGRPKDVSFVLDQATKWNNSHDQLKGRLDLNRIGMMGHSFGAYTTMVICGMRPALDWLEPAVAPGKGIGPDLSDARIACGIALSPQGANEPFFIEQSMASLGKPLMGISGTEDKQQGGLAPMTRYESFSYWPENRGKNKFVWLSNANHLDFTDSTGGEQQGMRSANRNDVQRVVRAASLIFLNSHLRKENSSNEDLTTSVLEKYLRGAIDRVEVRSK
jgi:predicted dienelactone hydrolase